MANRSCEYKENKDYYNNRIIKIYRYKIYIYIDIYRYNSKDYHIENKK